MDGDSSKGSEMDLGAVVRGDVEPLLLTIPEAARALAIGRTTLYELITERRIEVVHIGRCSRVPLDAVRAFVQEQRGHR